jgi:hypothetical protein
MSFEMNKQAMKVHIVCIEAFLSFFHDSKYKREKIDRTKVHTTLFSKNYQILMRSEIYIEEKIYLLLLKKKDFKFMYTQ